MNFHASPVILATALASAMISLPIQAEMPARLTPDELAAIRNEAVVSDAILKAAAETKERINESRRASNEANDTVRAFLTQAALTTISIENDPVPEVKPSAAASEPIAAPNKPLEVKEGPNDSIISADDGMYLDAEKGLLVYLKNVRLTSPEFNLSGANQLKVFLAKKAPKEKVPEKGAADPKPAPEPAPAPAPVEKKDDRKDDKKDAGNGLFGAAGGFGDPERISASGAIKITQKAVGDKPPVVASAAYLDYNVKTGEIILHGGYPWVQQGTTFLRSTVNDGSLRIQKDGSFVTGLERWDAGGQFINPGAKPAKPAKP